MNIDAPLKSHIPALRSLWHEAFGDTEEFLDDFFRTAFSIDRCRCVIENGEIVAALYWFDCLHMDRPVAYLYAVATARAYRGQGICRKLMADTHLHLSKLGYEGTILVPGSTELFRLYESMGYRNCCYIREICCHFENEVQLCRFKDNIRLSRIDKTEYAALRRQLLPKGGVIQENENLDFLQTQAQFYTGPGFLLTVREESNTLYGVELLGDATAAPEIVRTLGYPKGSFRTPGEDSPFAMYHPLGNSRLAAPSYFGLAFD